MKSPRSHFLVLAATAALSIGAAQSYQPVEDELRSIRNKLAALQADLANLRARHADDSLLADIEVYHKAAAWILRFDDEFYTKAYVANTLTALDTGVTRAKELAAGKASWPERKGRLARAYRSRVDGSVQPYGLIIPDSYDGKKPVRLDVVLHGRGATLNEVSFLAAHDSAQPVPPGQDCIQLDVFGRTNNAYRWAGETDVFEALESMRKRYNVDADRIVLRGFSMGGAGAWHIGLHYADLWAAVEAGAGFTETRRYAKLDRLPAYQEPTLRIYDAVDYALNAFNVPMIGYGGEDDPQLQASVNIREQLAKEGLKLPDLRVLFLVGPKMGHRFHPDSKKESDQFIAGVLPRRTPDRIRFVTYTTRYNRCFWITVDGLEKHYERAEVNGEGAEVTTKNIARLTLARRGAVTIDGQPFKSGQLFEKKRNGRWAPAEPAEGLHKRHGLQGPIDDAFLDSFLCVRSTGTPWNQAAGDYARRALDRFAAEYAKWLRGDLRVKDDVAITKSDIADHNLILFGDPGSNKLITQILSKLPIRWTRQSIALGKQEFSAAEHVPVMIYPNPLNDARYVVINSGHTFHEPEFRGTNALLFPRLGDYAVIRASSGDAILAGFFDEGWQLAPALAASAPPVIRP